MPNSIAAPLAAKVKFISELVSQVRDELDELDALVETKSAEPPTAETVADAGGRPVVYGRQEAARIAGISAGTIDEAIRRGAFPVIRPSARPGTRVLIPAVTFERWLRGETVGPTE